MESLFFFSDDEGRVSLLVENCNLRRLTMPNLKSISGVIIRGNRLLAQESLEALRTKAEKNKRVYIQEPGGNKPDFSKYVV